MKYRTRFDHELFANAIAAKMFNERLRYRDVGDELGITLSMIFNAAKGKPVTLEHFGELCAWLRTDPKEFYYSEPVEIDTFDPLPTDETAR